MTANTPDLLPCPFCGGPAEMEPWHGGGPDKQRIGCNVDFTHECPASASVTGDTQSEAVERWNTRAATPVNADLVGLLSRMVGMFELYARRDNAGVIFRHESDARTYKKARAAIASAKS